MSGPAAPEAALSATEEVTDGRLKRSRRTRAAVVDALLQLLREGDLRPTAPRIAERAGVSLRSVFQHFSDLGALHAAVAERQIEEIARLTEVIDAAAPLDHRIQLYVRNRGRVLEAVTPVRRASLVNAPSPEGHAGFETMRANSRDEVLRTFAPELEAVAERNLLIEAVDVATSWQTWEGLRAHQRLSVADAERVLARILTSLFAR